MSIIFKHISLSLVLVSLTVLLAGPALVSAETHDKTGAERILEGAKKSADKARLDTRVSETKSAAQYLSAAVGRALNTIFAILGGVMLFVILIGGYIWMTAGGSEEKIAKAKTFIVNGIDGMIVMFMAYALVYTILFALNVATRG